MQQITLFDIIREPIKVTKPMFKNLNIKQGDGNETLQTN